MCLAQAFVAEWLVALLFPEVSVHHLPKTVRTLNSHQPLNAHQSAEQVGQCVHIVHPNDSVRAVATAKQVDKRLQLRILANPPESQQCLVKHREPLVGHACVAYIIFKGFSHLLASMTLSPTRCLGLRLWRSLQLRCTILRVKILASSRTARKLKLRQRVAKAVKYSAGVFIACPSLFFKMSDDSFDRVEV